ncbi:MAG: DUF5615 family PIN-like protein [Bryobacterales bacterium]|nr:DUF5615 family PIN-like protein [Bryobacterales bacterium]
MPRPFRLYFDEDATWNALLAALRERGFDVLAVRDAKRQRSSDEAQLEFAASEDRVLITFNAGHFSVLHRNWIQQGKDHGGIVVMHQSLRSVGEVQRRLIRIRAALSHEQMRNQLIFLSNWA